MPHTNFSFLGKEFPLLHNLATAAEYYLYADPNAALMKHRQFWQKLTAYVYDTHQLDDATRDLNDQGEIIPIPRRARICELAIPNL